MEAGQEGPAPAESSPARGATVSREPSSRERAIVRRAAEARATVPDLELGTDVAVGACTARSRETGESLPAMLVRACALALRDEPEVNAAYRDGRFERYQRVNVGVVCEAPEGYSVPTILDADSKSVAELTAELDSLAGRSRDGGLSPGDLSGATFTLADFGSLGIDRWATLITPPQAAMLSAGAVRCVPAVREGNIVPTEMLTLTLGCDHRILHPHTAARWLRRVRETLEDAAL